MITHWQPPTLRGPRVWLRPVRESDADAVFTYASNPNVTVHTLFDTHRSLADSMAFVRDYTQAYYRERVPEPMAIVLGDDPDGFMIGAVGCRWESQPNRTMEIGFALGEPHWGQGLTAEAAGLLLDHVFTAYPVERVQAGCMVENRASARVLQKLGMTFEGTLRRRLLVRGQFRDLSMFSILRDEWESKPHRATMLIP